MMTSMQEAAAALGWWWVGLNWIGAALGVLMVGAMAGLMLMWIFLDARAAWREWRERRWWRKHSHRVRARRRVSSPPEVMVVHRTAPWWRSFKVGRSTKRR